MNSLKTCSGHRLKSQGLVIVIHYQTNDNQRRTIKPRCSNMTCGFDAIAFLKLLKYDTWLPLIALNILMMNNIK